MMNFSFEGTAPLSSKAINNIQKTILKALGDQVQAFHRENVRLTFMLDNYEEGKILIPIISINSIQRRSIGDVAVLTERSDTNQC